MNALVKVGEFTCVNLCGVFLGKCSLINAHLANLPLRMSSVADI